MSTLRIEGLTVQFGHGSRAATAVDDVSLDIAQGQIVGLVGESGSGKSTLARVAAGLLQPTSGRILLNGVDLARLRGTERRKHRRRIQMVFQDPYASLNPRITVGETIGEALQSLKRVGRLTEVARLLELVALDPAIAERLPQQLSGGQRQRVAIARALACEPEIIVADEITSALDASVQGAVLNLVRNLHAELGVSMLFISHNLATVRYVSDDVAVMRGGALVERLPADRLMFDAQHPYTRELIAAIPRLEGQPSVVDEGVSAQL